MNRSDLPLCEITLIQRVPFLLDPKTQECTHYTLSPSSENFSTLELLFVHIYPCPSLPVRSDGEHEEVHGQGTDGASNGDRPHPGKDDVPEKLPVHVLFGPDTPHRHHRANLTVGGANRDPHVGCQKNSQSRTNLNAEPTENRTQLCYYQTEAYPEHSIHSCCIPTF